MSGVVKAIGKVIGGVADAVGDVVGAVGDVVKKIWKPVLIAAAIYFTAGAAAGAMGGAAAGGAAAGAGTAGATTSAAAGAAGAATASGTAAAAMGPAASGIGATAGGAAGAAGTAAGAGAAAGNVAASGLHAGTAATGSAAGTAAGSGAMMTGGAAGDAMGAVGTASPSVGPAVSGTTATGAKGTVIKDMVANTVQMGQNAQASQVGQVAEQTIAQGGGSVSTGPGGSSAHAAYEAGQTGAAQLNQIGDTFASKIPGAGSGTEESSVLSSLKKAGGRAMDWADKHPYLTMWGAQTISHLGQPSEEELLERSRRWPGAFYGMTRDGRTAGGKVDVRGYAPGTEPAPSLLERARHAADSSERTVDPVDRDNELLAGRVRPNINQLNPNRRG